MKYSGNITSDHITIICSDGESGTVNVDHSGYEAALSAVRDGRFEDFMLIANPISVVHRYAGNRITIDSGIVTFDGEELHTTLADRMVDLIRDGHGVEPLANFLVNLHENTSKRAIDELYGFLEASQLEITADGYFVAYKKVNEQYLDCYTRQIDNSPGATVEMDRSLVDDDKDRTCSKGLHFCGRGYLNSYSGDRTVVLKINPRDVVSIPSDYHNHKGRCCKYLVIGELDNGRSDEGDRKEQTLEGSMFTGEGIDTVDDMKNMMGTSVPADQHGEDPAKTLDPTINPDDIVFYPSRTAARDAARHYNYLQFKDFGADKDKGFRWATIEH